jgi:hypothetical protein
LLVIASPKIFTAITVTINSVISRPSFYSTSSLVSSRPLLTSRSLKHFTVVFRYKCLAKRSCPGKISDAVTESPFLSPKMFISAVTEIRLYLQFSLQLFNSTCSKGHFAVFLRKEWLFFFNSCKPSCDFPIHTYYYYYYYYYYY